MRLIGAWLLLMVALMMGCGAGVSSGVVEDPDEVAVPATPVRPGSEVYQHSSDVTVALVTRLDDGRVVPFCTGVWVSHNEIMTAAHCVAVDDFGFLSPVGEKVHYIIQKEVVGLFKEPAAMHLSEVSYFHNGHDLAILKAAEAGIPSHPVASLATELPGVGEAVHIVGHPKGLYWTFSNGVISTYREESIIGPVIQINGTVWFGNSGGGVFDNAGNLIGICSRLTSVPNMNLFVHLDSLKSALETSRELEKVKAKAKVKKK